MQEILCTQLRIMRDNNHRRSSNKIWAQEGRLFLQKGVIFPSFSSVTMNFVSHQSDKFSLLILFTKKSKSLMLEVAKILELTTFLGQIP